MAPASAARPDEAIPPPRGATLLAADAHIVHLVAEYWPYARSGGLAEAVRGIATFQARNGRHVSVLMPLYGPVRQRHPELVPAGEAFPVTLGPHHESARLFTDPTTAGGAQVFFIDHPGLYGRDGLYGDDGGDFPDNFLRFGFLAEAALSALPGLTQGRVVLHAHDWHTALAPVLMRTARAGDAYFDAVAAVLSVHNAGYQGLFGPEVMGELGLPEEVYHWSRMEYFGLVNWLKGALAYSDYVGTVSPTHAHELRTAAGGFGLHSSFISLGSRLVGIINGIDLDIWDPETDPDIPANFSRDDLSGKATCKAELQGALGLPVRDDVPVFGMTARLVKQKGFDLLLGDGLLYRVPDAQFVFVGEGERGYRDALAEVAHHVPDRVAVRFDFTEKREHKLLAGADALLMPSLYEPCGLTQMRAQRYGALPVVRKVGGLSDTVVDQVTGFVFDGYTPRELEVAIHRAIALFRDREAWVEHVRHAMARDFGWDEPARAYLDVYSRALRMRDGE